jgi:hypothetical protein
MSGVTAAEIVTALEALRGVIAAVTINGRPLGRSVRFEPGASTGDPIEVNIAPPAFDYRSNCLGPTSMTVDVYVVAVQGDLSVHNMIALERGVADAIDTSDEVDATVTGSVPGVWRRGTTDLPAYVITATVGLP